MIQQGVSTGGIAPSDHNPRSSGMTVGRILDWIEARMEAVKSREEEEDEDEEREKDRDRARVTPPSTRTDAHKDANPFPSASSQKLSQTPSTSYRDAPVRLHPSSVTPLLDDSPFHSLRPPHSPHIPLSCRIISVCRITLHPHLRL